jgi:hypothetical protein
MVTLGPTVCHVSQGLDERQVADNSQALRSDELGSTSTPPVGMCYIRCSIVTQHCPTIVSGPSRYNTYGTVKSSEEGFFTAGL